MTEINEYRKELKSRIIDYAMTEFFKRGIRAVKMDEISQGLHVSKRTVYEIFGDKEELLLAGMKQQKEEMRKALVEFADEKARNVIDVLGYVYKLQMKQNEKVGPIFFEEIHRMPRVLEFLRETHEAERAESIRFFEAGIREGLFRKDMNYKLMLNIARVATEEVMHRQMYLEHSMNEIYSNWYLVIIRGICTERGLRLLNETLANGDVA